MRRAWIRVGALLLTGAMVWPALESPPRDSFPLSDYPMFTADRPRVAAVSTVVLIDDQGAESRLDPATIGGTDQPVQAAATVNRAVRRGEADELCREIADSLDRSGTLEVVTEEYDTVAWFRGDETPVTRVVHASCVVGEPT